MPRPLKAQVRVDVAKAYVAKIRATTVCEECGKQPIEWHHPSHAQGREKSRIVYLTMQGYPVEVIQAEIAICKALCRRCHMIEDGRLTPTGGIVRAQEAVKLLPPKPRPRCLDCGREATPVRHGLCNRCYNWTYRR